MLRKQSSMSCGLKKKKTKKYTYITDSVQIIIIMFDSVEAVMKFFPVNRMISFS